MIHEIKETVTLSNKLGLHARAAALFVKTASKFKSDITVSKNNNNVSGRSITGLIMLTAVKGSSLDIKVVGEDAKECFNELFNLINGKFGEEK